MAEKKTPEPVTEKRSLIYEVLRVLALIVFHTVMPVKCHNRERLDAEGPYVLIANHLHALDPVAMAMFIPKRQIVFLAKKELGKNKLIEKKILLIFPEGTRHHEGQMEHIESGASLIAMRSGSPVIPIYIDRKMGFFRQTNMYVGGPIPYDDLLEKGINAETCEEMNERFRETFRRMIAETEAASKKIKKN